MFSFAVCCCSFPTVATATGVVRARFGAARFGLSGVGLLSILSSRSSSSGSCRLFINLVGTCDAGGVTAHGDGWVCGAGDGQPCIIPVVERPNPKPSGEGEWPTGPGWKPTCKCGCVTTLAIVCWKEREIEWNTQTGRNETEKQGAGAAPKTPTRP